MTKAYISEIGAGIIALRTIVKYEEQMSADGEPMKWSDLRSADANWADSPKQKNWKNRMLFYFAATLRPRRQDECSPDGHLSLLTPEERKEKADLSQKWLDDQHKSANERVASVLATEPQERAKRTMRVAHVEYLFAQRLKRCRIIRRGQIDQNKKIQASRLDALDKRRRDESHFTFTLSEAFCARRSFSAV